MRSLRLAACLLVLVALSFGIYTYYVYAMGQNWDETFHVKGSLISPGDYTSDQGYRYAIDHPALQRYIYRAVLFGIGVRELNIPDVDYHKTEKWNMENGRIPPLSVVIPLRFTNAAFMTGAVVLLFLAAWLILGNAWLSLLVALPFVLSERMALGVVAYVGTDAILAFFLALTLFLWILLALRGRDKGLAGMALISAAAGLVASTKINGALVIIAFMLYLALTTRGVDRVAKPFLAALFCGLVFFAVNPIMRGGGIDWVISVVSDMLEMRETIWLSQFQEAPLARTDLIARFFPWAAFVLPLAGAAVTLRKERWVLPTVIWTVVIAGGTLMSVNRTYQRYYLPVEMSVFFAGGVAAWRLVQRALAERKAEKAARPWLLSRALPAASLAVAVALILVTLLAAFEPWGPMRIRRGPSAAGKVAILYRQSAAYYGAAAPLTGESLKSEVRKWVAPGSGAPARSGPQEMLFQAYTRQMMNTAVLMVALAVVVLIGRRALGSAWFGLLIIAPFIWTELTGWTLWTHPASEAYLMLFMVLALYLWVDLYAKGEAPSWRFTALVSLVSAAAAVASPRGMLVVVATAMLLFAAARGRGGLARALVSAVISVGAYAALEPALWYLGARGPLDLAQGMWAGALSYWTARFGETNDFLMPIQECFTYWPLLPLAAAALYAARRYAWAMPVAVWAGVFVTGAILTLGSTEAKVASDVTLALCIGAGLPGLALLKENVTFSLAFRDTAV